MLQTSVTLTLPSQFQTHLDLQAVQGGPSRQSDARSCHAVLVADMDVPHQHLQVLGEVDSQLLHKCVRFLRVLLFLLALGVLWREGASCVLTGTTARTHTHTPLFLIPWVSTPHLGGAMNSYLHPHILICGIPPPLNAPMDPSSVEPLHMLPWTPPLWNPSTCSHGPLLCGTPPHAPMDPSSVEPLHMLPWTPPLWNPSTCSHGPLLCGTPPHAPMDPSSVEPLHGNTYSSSFSWT